MLKNSRPSGQKFNGIRAGSGQGRREKRKIKVKN